MENYLDKFRDKILSINKSLNYNEFCFNNNQVEFAIDVLSKYLPEYAYIIEQNNNQVDSCGLNPLYNYILYHLAQAENSIGSMFQILEISCILYFFFPDKQLLDKKLRKKNGELNYKELRSSIFELYCASIFKLSGFNLTIDDNSNPLKPLDIKLNFNGISCLIECMTLNNTIIEDTATEIVSYTNNVISKNIKKYRDCFLLHKIPLSLYLVVRESGFLLEAKTKFKELLNVYYKSILKENYGQRVEVPFVINKEGCYEINIEPFKAGLFEAYSGYFENCVFSLKAQINFPSAQVDVEISMGSMFLEDRIKKAIESKQRQHRGSMMQKIYMFEYEFYNGIKTPMDINNINKERIRGILKEEEIVVIVNKDLTTSKGLVRETLIISNSGNNLLYDKLKKINYCPFFKIHD